MMQLRVEYLLKELIRIRSERKELDVIIQRHEHELESLGYDLDGDPFPNQ